MLLPLCLEATGAMIMFLLFTQLARDMPALLRCPRFLLKRWYVNMG